MRAQAQPANFAAASRRIERRSGPRVYDRVVVGGLRTACVSRRQLGRLMVGDCLAARGGLRTPRLVFASNGHSRRTGGPQSRISPAAGTSGFDPRRRHAHRLRLEAADQNAGAGAQRDHGFHFRCRRRGRAAWLEILSPRLDRRDQRALRRKLARGLSRRRDRGPAQRLFLARRGSAHL